MLSAALLFVSSFVIVLALGLQQMNVERRNVLAAALTSPVIGVASWVQFKLLPGPTTTLDIAAYLVGGALGIASSIWLHPALVRLTGDLRVLRVAILLRVAWIRDRAEEYSLARGMADRDATTTIKTYCTAEPMGVLTWYDTRKVLDGDPDLLDEVEESARYLHLRGLLHVHPVQLHLVRPL